MYSWGAAEHATRPVLIRSPLLRPGAVYELRAPKTRQGTLSGYFDNPELLYEVAKKLDRSVPGIYVTMNPVNPALLARAKNRVQPHAKTTTSDADILRREWLLLDCDAVRPADISASDSEHEAALERMQQIAEWLTAQGWPEPVQADSGNGGHLLYRIDLPNDAETRDLVKAVLEVVALKFNDAAVTVDTSVFNAARITKLYGTLACKGDSTDDRPHRRSAILTVPSEPHPVLPAKLHELASRRPAGPKPIFPGGTGTGLAARTFIERHGLTVHREKPWAGATVFELEHCPFNPEHARSSSILQFATGALGFQCFHNSCQGHHWQELRDLLEPDRRRRPTVASGPAGSREADGPVLVQLSTVAPELVRYLWQGRLARRKINLLPGDPGLGKTMIALDIAARITTGREWPDGGRGEVGNVLILSAEDGAADTLRPRLDRFRGDATRVHLLQAIRQGDRERPFSLTQDLPHLERALHDTGACLVVIDPLSAYLGQTDSFTDADVRGVLAPLAALADRYDVAVLAIMHLTKNSQTKALYRASGSIAFVAAARIVLLVAKDPEQEDRRLLVPLKTNICAPPPTLAFSITPDGSLSWDRTPVGDVDPDALLAQAAKPERRSQLDALTWLRGRLAQGPVAQSTILEEAAKLGISDATLRRAKSTGGIESRKLHGMAGGWVWKFPDSAGGGLQGDEHLTQHGSETIDLSEDAHQGAQ